MFEILLPFDLYIARIADSLRNFGGNVLTPIFKTITLSGNYGAIFIVIAAIMLFFKKTRKAGITVLLALVFGMIFTNVLLKNIIGRARPFIDVSSEFYKFWQLAGGLKESGYSFPSGHTTAAAAFGFAMFLHGRKKLSWLFLFVPLVMGFTRIYFVVHYASDILGGFIVGFVSAGIAYFIIYLLSKNKNFDKFFG